MASLTKKKRILKNGDINYYWQLTYYLNKQRYRKNFKKKPTIDEIAKLTKTVQKNPYFINAIEDYITSCSLHCKESTLETYKNYNKVTLQDLHFKRIKDLNREEMNKFFVDLRTKKAPKTYNNILMFLKGFFNYLIEIKVLNESPVKKIKSLPLGHKQAKALDTEVQECFIKHSQRMPFWVHLFFMTMLNMGLRISECIALETSDIDLINKKMRINKQFYRYRVTSTKNYETRIIDMPDALCELYKQHKPNSNIVFGTENGYASVNNIRERYFKRIIEAVEDELDLNLSDITPHCLRHTHATYLLSNGIPVKCVSERLGHKDSKTTLNIYNHVLPSDNKKAIDLLNKMYGHSLGTVQKLKA